MRLLVTGAAGFVGSQVVRAPLDREPRIVSSTARLHSEVGFRPRVSLDEGLQETIDWWQTQSVGAT
jgi:nucleoside-diphosphate-sugar epimerase